MKICSRMISIVLLLTLAFFALFPLAALSTDTWHNYSHWTDYQTEDGYLISDTFTFAKIDQIDGYVVELMPEITGKKRAEEIDKSNYSVLSYRSEWENLRDACPVVLVVSVSGNRYANQFMYTTPEEPAKFITTWDYQDPKYTLVDGFSRGGFSVWNAYIEEIIRNDTDINLRVGQAIAVKDDFYVYNDTVYTKYGTRQNPLTTEKTLVFASIVPEAKTTPLYSFNNSFRIRLDPAEKDGDKDQKSNLHSDEQLIADNFGYEILSFFGIDSGEYQPPKDERSPLVPILIGVGCGALVCGAAAVVIVRVRKRRKNSA